MLMFSNLTFDVLDEKLRSEDVVSCDLVVLEDSDKLSQPVSR